MNKLFINHLAKSLIERGYNPEDVYIVADSKYENIVEVYAIKSDVWVGEYDTEDNCWSDEDVDMDEYRDSYNDYISSYIY